MEKKVVVNIEKCELMGDVLKHDERVCIRMKIISKVKIGAYNQHLIISSGLIHCDL